MTNLVPLRVLIGLTLALTAVACTSRSRSIEVPGQKPVNSDDDLPTNDDDGKNARATLSIPQSEVAAYLDPNAKIDYKFKYLDVEQDGEVQFQNGTGLIELTQLPSGLDGKMELTLFEAGEAKLAGSLDNVKLNAGANKLTIPLKPLDNGNNGNPGDKNADLELEVVVDDGSGTNTNTNTGTGTGTSTGGAPTFTDVKALAVKGCFGSCHFHRDGGEEGFWKSRTKELLIAKMNGEGTSIMPPANSDEEKALTPAEKQKLIDYANSL